MRGLVVISVVAVFPFTLSYAAEAATTQKYTNCGSLNGDFPHGVGKPGAHDKAKNGDPVTNFTVNAAVYNAHSARLDRDRDGIACERH